MTAPNPPATTAPDLSATTALDPPATTAPDPPATTAPDPPPTTVPDPPITTAPNQPGTAAVNPLLTGTCTSVAQTEASASPPSNHSLDIEPPEKDVNGATIARTLYSSRYLL